MFKFKHTEIMFNSKYIIKATAVLATALMVTSAYAGNPDRAGSAGGIQLLINPWAKGSGLANAGTASMTGAEAMYSNVAGLAFTRKTEVMFTHTNYLVGADLSMNAFGFSQKVGESGVVGLTVNTLSFGDVEVTNENAPDGGIGTYNLGYTNIGVSYAKVFSNSIYGGLTLRLISESTSQVNMQGACFDAGIRYVTGKRENVRFGIALRNVGPPISYSGDGISKEVQQNGNNYTFLQRADKFELPSLLNIGAAYDFLFIETLKLGANANFQSNSFSKDQFSVGLDLSMKDRFAVRAGYMIEDKGKSTYYTERTNVWSGLGAGFSVNLPINKDGGTFSIDYSYRTTNPFSGIHSIGARLNL